LVGNARAQTFQEVSRQAGIDFLVYSPTQIGGGCAFFDYDNDGWLDIYITGGLHRDLLYHNNQDGTFTETGIQAGLWITAYFYTMGVVTGDIDNDGYRDIFVTTLGIGSSYHSYKPNFLFRNNGNGTFTDISQQAGITNSAWSVSATMGDYNLDGFLDIYVANYVDTVDFIFDPQTQDVIGYNHSGFPNFLYLNNGNRTFTTVASALRVDDDGTGLAAVFTDYDNDRDPDIYVVNDFGAWVSPNRLYVNNYPANSFTDVSVVSGADAAIYGMGIAIGDYDEDDDLDYYITNIGENVFLQNNGSGFFSDVAAAAGVANGHSGSLLTTGWGAAFLDYDNDTWLDLFVSNGHIPAASFIATTEKDPKKLYRNNTDGTFADVSVSEGVSDSSIARGCAMGDYDNDGDLDLLVVVIEEDTAFTNDEHTLLYRNDIANGNHWLKVKLQGTQSNRDGFGSRVEAYSNGRKWIREIDGGSSHASQHSTIAHFGLGNSTTLDSVVVLWSRGGKSFLANVPADRTITITEGALQSTIQQYIDICEGDSIFAAGAFQKITGVYYDTFTLSGIDSIVVTHLTVLQAVITVLTDSICEGDSIFLAGAYRKTGGDYYDTLSTGFGCDSIIHNQLTVMPLLLAIADAFLCEGDSIFAGGAWQKQSGNYMDTIPASPCDMVIITSVFFAPPETIDTIRVSICEGDSFFAAGAWRTSAGFYPDTFESSFGCDTIMVTELEVIRWQILHRDVSLCEGDSVFAGGSWQKESGEFYDTVPSSPCYAVMITGVAIIPSQLDTVQIFFNEGDSVFAGGAWQHAEGFYPDTFHASLGCDSIVITHLRLNTFAATPDAQSPVVRAYPNPSTSGFTISYIIPANDYVEINIHSSSGKLVASLLDAQAISGTHSIAFRESLAPGVYFISFKTGRYLKFMKAVVTE